MATSAPPSAVRVPAAAPPGPTNQSLALREVKPPVPIINYWLYGTLALVLAALIAWFLWWLLRERRRRRQLPPELVVIPPHRRARDLLRAALELIHQPKPFCSQVADTLRVYLEERFRLHAPDRTSEEFLEEVQASPVLTRKQKEILADFLTRCDLVKFARHEPAEPELRGLWETALELIEETSPDATASDVKTSTNNK
jgi:hypothetical protein